MGDKEKIFGNLIRTENLSDDFEDKVFRKIKRKKRQKTAIVSTLGIFFLGGFIFISGTFFFSNRGDTLVTGNNGKVREEIPLTDYVTFAASDETYNYVIEQVGDYNDLGTI